MACSSNGPTGFWNCWRDCEETERKLLGNTAVVDRQQPLPCALELNCVEENMKKTTIAALTLLVATTTFAAGVVKRGAPVSASKPVALTAVLESPRTYTKDAVVVEGVIEKSCSAKGCWMELAPAAGKKSVRVTFKDEKFFIPLTAKGMKARAEGVTEIKTLSKDEADHLAGDGATFTRNADGTVDEVAFVATGVELTKP
jgi:Domain of unknown function (DUF4920)